MRDIIKYAEAGNKHMNSDYDMTLEEIRRFIKSITLVRSDEAAYYLLSLIFNFGYEAGYRARTAEKEGDNEAQTY